jgi:hypothetical protein
MPAQLVAEQTITVGQPTVIKGLSPSAHYGVTFEDNGQTGYFYALDFSRVDNQLVDALHIYNVEQVVDRDKPSVVQLAWSPDGLKAVLLINGHPHAVFDFDARRGYCRTGFPPPPYPHWTEHDHAWDDRAVDVFR